MIGSNGKGMTLQYALASAYAEFFERLQNNWFLRNNTVFADQFAFRYFADEKLMSAEEIVANDNAFICKYFNDRSMTNASFEDKVNAFKNTQKIDYLILNETNRYICVPFVNVTAKQITYLPYNTYNFSYGSNGMCAGNTAEEALIQGISEIIERLAQKKIQLEKPLLPDVPEEYIKQFPEVYNILHELRKNTDYNILLKDCSFGGKYPVAALVIIEKNTGKYGIKFGCNPDFGVAIERALTEAGQGNEITKYCNRSTIDLKNNKVDSRFNIYNCYKTGMGQFPYEIFKKCSNPFTKVKDVSNMTNKEILSYLLDLVINDGYQILIRDVSYLGFPSYHIIIPNMSEMLDLSDKDYENLYLKTYFRSIIKDPSKINKKDCNAIISMMDYYSNMHFENLMRDYYGILTDFDIPAEEYASGWLYFTIMCFIYLKQYKNASQRMEYLVKVLESKNFSNITYYKALSLYLTYMDIECSHSNAIDYLKVFFELKICDKIDNIFCNCDEVFIKQYPNLSDANADTTKLIRSDYFEYSKCIHIRKKRHLENNITQENLIDTLLSLNNQELLNA